MKWQFALVYLKDTIIIYNNADEHISYVQTVLSLLQKAGVTLNRMRCKCFPEKTDYFGRVKRPGKLEQADHTSDIFRDLMPPRNVNELNCYLDYETFTSGLYRILPA